MTKYNLFNIPMKICYFIKIFKLNNYKNVDIKPYKHLIAKLIYLWYGIRPDIVFAVSQFTKHNSDPRARHMKAAKKEVRYLKKIMHLELVYISSQNKVLTSSFLFDLIKYKENSYAENFNNNNSMMDYYYSFNKAVVF